MPDDLDLRRQRETDKAEVRRLESEISEQITTTPRAMPDRHALGAAVGHFLEVVATAAPERGREILARCVSPLTVTPKIKGSGRFHVSGSIDLNALVSCPRRRHD
jgi:hypothetical protein